MIQVADNRHDLPVCISTSYPHRQTVSGLQKHNDRHHNDVYPIFASRTALLEEGLFPILKATRWQILRLFQQQRSPTDLLYARRLLHAALFGAFNRPGAPSSIHHQPASALFDASSTLVLGTHTQAPLPRTASTAPATLDNPPETTPEADADTARLLARTLAVNAVNSSVSWDAMLRRLGLNPAQGRDAAKNAALEGLAVRLDSTHRKRRKKMKKHKCVSLLYLVSFFPLC